MTENKEALPGHETQSSEMNCPSCGRFVGAVTKCPYCGAKVQKRMSLVAVRWAAVLLATLGLFLLYLMAKHREVPVVMIGNIQPTMNFGQIRIVGQVETDARPFRSGAGASFNVSDGTGRLIVFATKKQMDEMNARNLLPQAGDAINLVGSLNISDEGASLRLLSLNDFQLIRAPAASVQIAGINDTLAGQSVTVAGQITDVIVPPAGTKRPYVLKLKDDSGEVSLKLWPSDYDKIQGKEALNGAFVRARIAVGSYEGKLDLKLSSGADLEVLDGPPGAIPHKTPAQKAAATYHKEQAAAPRDFSRGRLTQAELLPLGAITAAHDGQTVRVRGRVASVRAPEAGTKQPFSLILQEGDASLRVTYWSNINEVIAVKPAEGAEFEIEGEIEVYKDKPGLKVESGYKVKQVAAAPAAAPAAAADIGALTAGDQGRTVAVTGTLGAPRDLGGKGTAYALAGAGGAIDLVLWNSIIPAEVRDSLKEGQRVSAAGVVGVREGQLQLKANPGASVQVLP